MNPYQSVLNRQPAIIQLILLSSLAITSAFIFSMASYILVKPLFHITGADVLISQMSNSPDSLIDDWNKINALKFIQVMSSIGLFIVPAIVFSYIQGFSQDYLKTKNIAHVIIFLLALLLILASSPIIGKLYELNMTLDISSISKSLDNYIQMAEKEAANLTKLFLQMPHLSDLIVNLIVFAFIPAMGEELLFRGCVQRILNDKIKNYHIAIWTTAALFSFVHFQFLGFLPRMFLGALLGYLFVYSNSIWVPVVTHFLVNGLQVVASYLFQNGKITFDIESTDSVAWSSVMISLPIFCFGFYYLYQYRVKEKIEENPINNLSITNDENKIEI